MSNYPVYGIGLEGKLPDPLIPQVWAYAAKASSLEFVSIMSGKHENQFSFLRLKKLHSSLLSTWWLWGLYLSLKILFFWEILFLLACWAWSSSLNIGAWCHLSCCILAASSSFALPYLTDPVDIWNLQRFFRWCWTPLFKQGKQGPYVSICYGKMCFPCFLNEIESALWSQHPHRFQPESLHWNETIFRSVHTLHTPLCEHREQRWDLRETSLLNQQGWHVHLKDLKYIGEHVL